MKLLKALSFVSVMSVLFMINPLYAQADTNQVKSMKITPAEKASLATIAAIDKMEIMVSVVANNKKPTSGVADFAQMMIDQHGSNLTEILVMANRYNAIPLVSPTEMQTVKEGARELIKLGGLDGQQFDKAYVDMMVKGHEGALKLIDDKLLKTAKTEEIKQFITNTRAVVAQHLEHAKALQAKMQS